MTLMSAVKRSLPSSFPGAAASREPEIHNHRRAGKGCCAVPAKPVVMDSGLATAWRPGMTTR
jgi:hypothetical protein